jgi:dihydrofolate reductase
MRLVQGSLGRELANHPAHPDRGARGGRRTRTPTFSINVTLDGCVDHQEGIADDETHAFFTRLMDEGGAMLWGRVTYEMMESYWPAVARGDVEAPPAMREWAVKLEAKPKYVVSSTRKDFPWTNSHHIAGDLRTGVQKLKDATPAGVLLGSGKLATELDRLDLIDEYKFLVHPRIAGHGPTLYQSGLPSTRRLELVSANAAAQRRGRHALPARALVVKVFREAVGVSPKTYLRLGRFNRTLHRLHATGTASLADIAAENGFSDQAHMTREFGAIAGVTPGRYRELAPLKLWHVPLAD